MYFFSIWKYIIIISRSRSHLIYSQLPISNRCTEQIECIDHSCWRESIAKHEPFFSFPIRVFIHFDLRENVHHCMKHAVKQIRQHRKFGNNLIKIIDEKKTTSVNFQKQKNFLALKMKLNLPLNCAWLT